MKKPVFLILIGIGVLLLVGGVVFVVPWFGKMMEEMEQITEQHRQHRRALKMSAREPLTDEQENLLSQLLEIVAETDASQNPNDLEGVLSSEPYLAYLKVQEGADYEDFPAYVDAMPTENMKTIALSRIKNTLGMDKGDTELDVWTNYYFIVREWGITVEDPRDNIKELNEPPADTLDSTVNGERFRDSRPAHPNRPNRYVLHIHDRGQQRVQRCLA